MNWKTKLTYYYNINNINGRREEKEESNQINSNQINTFSYDENDKYLNGLF
jgi:hypothetical protein